MLKQKRKRKRHRGVIVQGHHISYDPEWKVPIYKGEHWILTLLNRRKKISEGLIIALKEFIRIHETQATDLSAK